MRDSKGRFVDGEAGINTRFKKGEHWRNRKLWWNREWLYNEYVVRGRSINEIATEFGVTDNAIDFWLDKHNIPKRTVSEARAIKHWGLSGKDNPMYGKRGPDVPNWKGGVTQERQAFYSSLEWKRAARQVWKRDRATCQRCGKVKIKGFTRGSFHIHHLVSFAVVELRARISNLILLCNECHHWVHSLENINKDFINE